MVIETNMYANRHITVIVPAYNEELSIARVLSDLRGLHSKEGNPLIDEIIVCDNASTDKTRQIAEQFADTVVVEASLGYGAACQAGLAVPGERDIIVFVDADCSVKVDEMQLLLEPLRFGTDLVIGSRVLGYRETGALTIPQRFGNWLASYLIRRLWGKPVTDLGPFRSVTWTALKVINMQDRKFGWTVEMQVRAIQENLTIAEVPVSSLKRVGKSKISGTVSGVIGAGIGILGMIFRLRWRQLHRPVGDQLSTHGSRL